MEAAEAVAERAEGAGHDDLFSAPSVRQPHRPLVLELSDGILRFSVDENRAEC